MAPWLIMLCFYFGRWPAWINFFVESCKWNPDIRWRIYTDCGEPENRASNIDFVPISVDDYKALARNRLGINFDPAHVYKICDLRPCLGYIHEQDIVGYPFFGYGDLDVVYGKIASFYGDALADFDVASTHPERLSGHFAVFRNTPALRHAFERVPNYRAILELPQQTAGQLHMGEQRRIVDGTDRVQKQRDSRLVHAYAIALQQTGWDEAQFSGLFLPTATERTLFVERFSTVLSKRGWHDGTMNYPQRWFWRRGRLTNDRDGEREFLYLHFMRWQSAHWINDPPAPGEAAWVGRDIVHLDWRRAAQDGFCVSVDGFTPHSGG